MRACNEGRLASDWLVLKRLLEWVCMRVCVFVVAFFSVNGVGSTCFTHPWVHHVAFWAKPLSFNKTVIDAPAAI